MSYKQPPSGRQFKPGQSGNPRGYSRGRRITDALDRLIEANDAAIPLATVWLKSALEGDIHFFRLLLDRVEGPIVPEAPAGDVAEEGAETKVVDIVGTAEQRALERIAERATDQSAGPVL